MSIDRQRELHLLSPEARSEQEGTFVLPSGGRTIFLASPELAAALRRSPRVDELRADLRSQVSAEFGRLARQGFWGTASQNASPAATRNVVLGLHLAHACNMACTYCSANQGTYGGPRALMSQAVADAALEFLRAEQERAQTPALLVLFGGEPTLNWEVLARTIERFRILFPDPPHDAWVVTNATLLSPERAALLARLQILTVVSLDGPPEVHDATRRFAGTSAGSYERTVAGLRHLEAAGARHTVRGTWVPEVGNRLEQLAHLRAVSPDALQVTVAPDYHATEEAAERFAASVMAEWDAFEGSGYQGRAPASAAIYIDLVLRGPWAPPMDCPAGISAWSVAPSGDVYVCQVAVANDRARLGNVQGGPLDPVAIANARQDLHFEEPGPACADCALSGFCSGPCRFVRPLMKSLPHCRQMGLELERASRYAARVPAQQLAARYQVGLVSQSDLEAFRRGAAMRDIAWQLGRHLRPLALCPSPSATLSDAPERPQVERGHQT